MSPMATGQTNGLTTGLAFPLVLETSLVPVTIYIHASCHTSILASASPFSVQGSGIL